jgi:hypothetical protein
MLATLRSNISDLLRDRPLQTIFVGSLALMVVLCILTEAISWPLLPVDRNELIAPWKNDVASLDITYAAFEDQSVIVRVAGETYPVRITGSEIIYLDGRPSQPYRFGKPLSSLVISTYSSPLFVISTPGPIPMGTYVHQILTLRNPPVWELNP